MAVFGQIDAARPLGQQNFVQLRRRKAERTPKEEINIRGLYWGLLGVTLEVSKGY